MAKHVRSSSTPPDQARQPVRSSSTARRRVAINLFDDDGTLAADLAAVEAAAGTLLPAPAGPGHPGRRTAGVRLAVALAARLGPEELRSLARKHGLTEG